MEGVTEGCRVAALLPGGSPGRSAPDSCSRVAENHIPSAFEDKLMEIGKHAQNADVLEAFLPAQGRGGALGTMHQVPCGLKEPA